MDNNVIASWRCGNIYMVKKYLIVRVTIFVFIVMNQGNAKTNFYLWINGKAVEVTALPH